MSRVAVIGLDGVEPKLIEELMASGVMPKLDKIRQRSSTCDLVSESTWRSGRVWETLLTGKADFPSSTVFDPGTYNTTQLGSRRKTPFYATIPSLNVVALDVPYMSLWYETAGAQVIWGGHDAGYPRSSRPSGLLREIDDRFGVHPAFHNDFSCAWYHAPSINSLSDALVRGSRKRVEVLGWLMEQNTEWDLCMTVLSEAHSAGEIFWHGMDPNQPVYHSDTATLARQRLVEIYKEIDNALGCIVDMMPEGTLLVVCSLHGMKANTADLPSMVLLPELLHRAHFGKTMMQGSNARAWRQSGYPVVTPPHWQKWSQYMRERFGAGRVKSHLIGVKRALGIRKYNSRPIEELTVPIIPETDLSPSEIDEPHYNLDWQVPCWYRPYWPEMRAFALPAFYDGRVRINLQGRERNGTVPHKDYDKVCQWIMDLLGRCRDPRDGAPSVANIEHLRKSDPLDTTGPDADLLIEWKSGVDAFEHPDFGIIGPFPLRRTGGHTNRGIAYFSGDGIESNDLGVQEALHLTPTILALLGYPPDNQQLINLAKNGT